MPTYYARLIQDIADAVTLKDRHQTTLFVRTAEDCEAIERISDEYNVICERGTWLQLDSGWLPNERIVTDYGIVTHEGNVFLDRGLVAVVQLAPWDDPVAEFESALEQADEHAIATLTQEDGRRLLAVDRHQVDLLAGIARAYRCAFEIFLPASV
ncbi:hypothetical protein GZH47_05755 [Paenibacillus rhizovicinus]|uniref:Uncharacterized protein n=1 Tax=Paenibacillus rhizovicinus TaxID=2704463 RepID=A0A6C0NW72_9BACL|nr:hypothetical protein [Paenibacillus rhizovicinus]QHW30398.1 hypothetical protein GZH47_05755 [Paenibacillus rhizovicinus]